MLKLCTSACIDSPVEKVWEQLARLEDIQLWSEPVLNAHCDGALSNGVGAERTCQIAGNRTIHEKWVEWEEGHAFKYEGYGIPMMKRATNHWSVQAVGEKTLLTSEAELEFKGGVFGLALERIMGPMMQRMAPDSLAGFKYLVEHGKPYEGKFSELPRVSAVC